MYRNREATDSGIIPTDYSNIAAVSVRPLSIPSRRAENKGNLPHRLHRQASTIRPDLTPASTKVRRIAAAISTCGLIYPLRTIRPSSSGNSCLNFEATSSPTSKQSGHIHAPMLTSISLTDAPCDSIAFRVRAAMRPTHGIRQNNGCAIRCIDT